MNPTEFENSETGERKKHNTGRDIEAPTNTQGSAETIVDNKLSLAETQVNQLSSEVDRSITTIEAEVALPSSEVEQIRTEVGLLESLNNIRQEAKTLLGRLKEKIPHTREYRLKKEQQVEIEKRIIEVENLLGSSLEVTERDSATVKKYLEDLGLMPDKLLILLKNRGLKVRIGDKDAVGLMGAESFGDDTPLGWGDKSDFHGIGGAYITRLQTVVAGTGESGSSSTILHEYGHGVGDLLAVEFSDDVINTHKRLYPKLEPYFQQGGPGGNDGTSELVAESLANYFKKTKEEFIAQYDEEWYSSMEKIIHENEFYKLYVTRLSIGNGILLVRKGTEDGNDTEKMEEIHPGDADYEKYLEEYKRIHPEAEE